MKSTQRTMQEILPGSTTFEVRLLCPNCGWHFKHGLTDPEGKVTAMQPDIVTVCGQCLAVLKTTADSFVKFTEEDLRAMDTPALEMLGRMKLMAWLGLMVVGPEPEGTKQ